MSDQITHNYYTHFAKLALVLVLAIASISVNAHTSGGIVVKKAWVREAPPVAKVLAAYMVIENHTNKDKVLSSITSSTFKKVEVHKTIQKDGMASMEKLNQIIIPAENKVVLKPGGTHLMLFNPSKPIKSGDNISFILIFSNGSKSIINAKVKKGNGASHHHEKTGHNDGHGHHKSIDVHKQNTQHNH